jgi:uncharacterized membrane protein YphA (DoxX/SURF4 family)
MIETYVTDPGFALTVRWSLAIVFLLAVIHKLKAPVAFKATMKNYRLLPDFLLTPFLYAVIAAELVAVVALLANRSLGSGIAAGLFTVYTLAILINLIRGRRDIDCGCSGPAIRQTLSGWLVVRNSGFLAVALLTITASNPRPLVMLDLFTSIAAVATFVLLYFAATYLASASTRFSH